LFAIIEQQAASREKDKRQGAIHCTWKRQGTTGLFFVNIESNSSISSIIVVSRGEVMCMDGWCWHKRPLIDDSMTWASGEIAVMVRGTFFGRFYSANKMPPGLTPCFIISNQRPMQQ
jgi:hypothetical protein